MNTEQPIFSIIVVTYNHCDVTRRCVESIFQSSQNQSYELILVDNGSTDETPLYLQSLEKENKQVRVFLNQENKGFSGGNNEGLRQARGEYIVLLNNDTRVFPGWLDAFAKIFEHHPNLGLLGPISNSVSTNQLVFPCLKKDLSAWAKHLTQLPVLKIMPCAKLSFFCVAMRREVFEKVGFLDEQFGLGMFEDDDYCFRVLQAGYTLAYTKNVFVFHEGSVSIGKMDRAKYTQQWQENRSYFEKKWNVRWKPNLFLKTTVLLLIQKRRRLISYLGFFVEMFFRVFGKKR